MASGTASKADGDLKHGVGIETSSLCMKIISKDVNQIQGRRVKTVWVKHGGTALERTSVGNRTFWRANDGSPGNVRGGRSKEELEEKYREATSLWSWLF